MIATKTSLPTDTDTARQRRAMVDSQLRPNGVTDVRLLDAVARVPREAFVPGETRAAAYIDRPVPLGGGRALNPPMVTALLLNAAAIGLGDRVLVIGAASGYILALAESIAGEVIGVESDSRLADLARSNCPAATIVTGPLAEGAATHAPYDAIVIDGAVDHVPDVLVAQLKPDGRLTAGIVDRGVTRLALGRRGGTGFGLVDFADAEVVVLPGFARPKSFVF